RAYRAPSSPRSRRFEPPRWSFRSTAPATRAIPTLPLPDALPILLHPEPARLGVGGRAVRPSMRERAALTEATDRAVDQPGVQLGDRKSTRLNSSHVKISYAVFCLKKKRQARGTPTGHAACVRLQG